MKTIFHISILLFLLSCKSQNIEKGKTKIDLIENEWQIAELIHSIDSKFKFDIKNISDFKNDIDETPCKTICDSLKTNDYFYKADLDGNGYLDLIVSGIYYREFSLLAILSYEKDNYKLRPVPKKTFQNCIYFKVNNIENSPLIDFYFYDEKIGYRNGEVAVLEKKQFIYKFDDFIEFNSENRNYQIEKIDYSTTGCFGYCPVFKISINSNKSASFEAFQYNQKDKNSKEFKGNYNAEIDVEKFRAIIDLLNYIDVKKLKDKYFINATDNPTANLKITFEDGSIKTIKDYGMKGTNGLRILFDLLADLRFNQDWK